jgi:LysR family glycine cleavage system transcriptional activator
MERATGQVEMMRLRLAVPSLFASQRLMPNLPALRALHPDLHIDIDTGPNRLARLDEGLDAAIAITTEIDPSLYSRRLDSNCVIAIGSRDLKRTIREPAQLAGATIFLHRDMPETFDLWRDAIGLPDLQPAAIDHFDSGQLILDAAAQGLGVAFMLESHLYGSGDDRLRRAPVAAVERGEMRRQGKERSVIPAEAGTQEHCHSRPGDHGFVPSDPSRVPGSRLSPG